MNNFDESNGNNSTCSQNSGNLIFKQNSYVKPIGIEFPTPKKPDSPRTPKSGEESGK